MDVAITTPRSGSPRGRFETLIKAIQTPEGVIIEGYASTPAPDRGDDVVLPTAFSGSLATYMTNPVLLWDHGGDPEIGYKPIGKVLESEITKDGLRVRASITNTDIAGMVQRGELRTMSFGYEIPEEGCEWVDNGAGKMLRVIKQLELYEISVVAMPMNPNARFSMAKSLKAYFATTPVDGSRAHANAARDTASPDASSLSHTPMPEQDTKSEEVVAEVVAPVETPETKTEDPAVVVVETPAVVVEEPAVIAEEPLADTPAPADADTKAADETPAPAPAVEEKAAELTATPAPAMEPEIKAVLPTVDPEVKTLADKAGMLAVELKAATTRIATLEGDQKKADATLALLTDRFLAVEHAVKRMPMNQPLAVVGPVSTPQKAKSANSLLDRLTISAE